MTSHDTSNNQKLEQINNKFCNALAKMAKKVSTLLDASMSRLTITKDNIANLDKGTPVISSANKFVLTIPKTQGEPLVDPNTGKAITDWEGKPVGESGIVFYNAKDNAIQAAPTDGNAVIIINEVNEEQANKLQEKVLSLAKDPTNLTLANIKEILEYAQSELGLKDMYNSDNGFISKKMSSVGSQMRDSNGNLWGRLKRDDRDVCQAVLIKGPLTFKKQSGEQGVVSQECKDEAVLVKQGDDVRLVQLDVFLRTYKNTDGLALTKDSITKAEYTA